MSTKRRKASDMQQLTPQEQRELYTVKWMVYALIPSVVGFIIFAIPIVGYLYAISPFNSLSLLKVEIFGSIIASVGIFAELFLSFVLINQRKHI